MPSPAATHSRAIRRWTWWCRSRAWWPASTCRRSAPIAPHPNAAKLWMEYLYSDEGQLELAQGLLPPDPIQRPRQGRQDPAGVARQAAAGCGLRSRRVPDARRTGGGQGGRSPSSGIRSSAPTCSRPPADPSQATGRPADRNAAAQYRSSRAVRSCMARRHAVLRFRGDVPDPADLLSGRRRASAMPTAISRCRTIANLTQPSIVARTGSPSASASPRPFLAA